MSDHVEDFDLNCYSRTVKITTGPAKFLVKFPVIQKENNIVPPRPSEPLLLPRHLRLDDHHELQHLQTSPVRRPRDSCLKITKGSFRAHMFGQPSNTITRSLMVGYGVPLAIVLIMGIGENHKDSPSVL